MKDNFTEATSSRLEEMLKGWLDKARIPGIAAGVVKDQSLVWSKGFGFSDLARRRAPDGITVARVASITKTFTALAIMQLRDDVLLALDDPLVLHMPEFSGANPTAGRTEDVTIRRLLTHRSGLTSEPPLPGWDALKFPSMQEILDAMPNVEVVIPQDSAFKYSNFAFALLGEVVSRLTGRTYADYVRENVITPLGMSLTDFDLRDDMKQHFDGGYCPAAYEDYPSSAKYAHMNGMSAAGQLHSNVHDLAKWVSFQFRADGGKRQGAQVLDGGSLSEMHRPVYIEPDWSAGQALSWRVTRVRERVYHGHGGGIHGFGTQVMFNVPSKIGVIVLTNLWPSTAAAQIATEMLECLLDHEAAKVGTTIEFDSPPERCPDSLAPYLGRYRAEPGVPAVIEFRGGRLRFVNDLPGGYSLHAPAALELTERTDVLHVIGGRGSGEHAVFERDGDGRVTSYALGGFVFRKSR